MMLIRCDGRCSRVNICYIRSTLVNTLWCVSEFRTKLGCEKDREEKRRNDGERHWRKKKEKKINTLIITDDNSEDDHRMIKVMIIIDDDGWWRRMLQVKDSLVKCTRSYYIRSAWKKIFARYGARLCFIWLPPSLPLAPASSLDRAVIGALIIWYSTFYKESGIFYDRIACARILYSEKRNPTAIRGWQSRCPTNYHLHPLIDEIRFFFSLRSFRRTIFVHVSLLLFLALIWISISRVVEELSRLPGWL